MTNGVESNHSNRSSGGGDMSDFSLYGDRHDLRGSNLRRKFSVFRVPARGISVGVVEAASIYRLGNVPE